MRGAGEIVVWRSFDEGGSWLRAQTLTANSTYNPPTAAAPRRRGGILRVLGRRQPRRPTASHLYFCTAAGGVFRMPYDMADEWAAPEP